MLSDHPTTRTRPLLLALGVALSLPLQAHAQPPAAGAKAPPPPRPKRPEPVTISIDPTKARQEILGFGCSGSWWAPVVGAWTPEQQAPLLDLLFTQRGAALTIYRHNVGAGSGEDVTDPSRRSRCVKPARDADYDWSADAHAAGILRGAVERGVGRVVFCSYSPPAWMLKNTKPSGGDRGQPNLPPAEHAAFAGFLLDVASHYRSEYHIAYTAISPVNEPQWRWGQRTRTQEGCAFDPPQVVDLLRTCVEEAALRDEPIAVEGPELGQWGGSSLEYLHALADDDATADSLAAVSIHSYWSSRVERRKAAELVPRLFPRTPIHMSEWCEMLAGRADDGAPGIESALAVASTIHEDLALANASAWSFWLGASPHDYRDGLVTFDPESREPRPTPRLWALAHYARFVPPASRRLEASVQPANTLATAFAAPDNTCVLVLVNPSDSPRAVTIACPGYPRPLDAHLTDATRALADVPPSPLELPPRSIATIRLAPAAP